MVKIRTLTPEVIDVNSNPFSNQNNYPKKEINKKGIIISLSFALMILALASYFVNISFMHNIGAVITLAACLYSIYNLNKVNL